MIRQAHTYLAGAMSGTVLIGAAIAVFVLLVSAQVFKQWPVASLGSSGPAKTEVSDARSVSHAPAPDPAVKAPATNATPAPDSASRANKADGDASAVAPRKVVKATAEPVAGTESPGPTSVETPSGSPGTSHGSPGKSPSQPSSPQPSSAPSSGATGGSGGAGGGGEKSPPSSGGGGSQTPAPVSAPAKTVTETVNKTVTGVDETVTGGALQETGVTHVTEEVVNGVAGPESVVGGAVEEVGKAAGGLLGAGH